MKLNGVFGGGNVHMDTLERIYRENFGLEVFKDVSSFKFREFDAFSNTIALIKALFLPVDKKYREFYPKTIVIAPNPYPFYVIPINHIFCLFSYIYCI